MKTKMNRPWMCSNGKPLCDTYLKRISKTWDAQTWERYLDWYQSPRHETLIDSTAYDTLCDQHADTVYAVFGNETDESWRSYCNRLLKTLPKFEEKVVRLYLYEGLTELEIAKKLKRSQGGIHLLKKKALFRLKKNSSDADLIALRIMRGLVSQNEVEIASPWDNAGSDLAQENLNTVIHRAFGDLSETQKQIVHLRYFCDQPFSLIARKLGIGINVAQEISDVAVFKIKSRVASEMNSKMEVPSCA